METVYAFIRNNGQSVSVFLLLRVLPATTYDVAVIIQQCARYRNMVFAIVNITLVLPVTTPATALLAAGMSYTIR